MDNHRGYKRLASSQSRPGATERVAVGPEINKLQKQLEGINGAIESISQMQNKEEPFVPRSYKAWQRNIFFGLLSVSLVAECLYFLFQEDTSEKGLSPYFPNESRWVCLSIAYIAALGDWDANCWTISPRDDVDEYFLTGHAQSYTAVTRALVALYYITGCVSFPIGAAGGWLGLDTYTKKIHDHSAYLATNGLFFALLVAVGFVYYLAWTMALANLTFAGIDECQKEKKLDVSYVRYPQVLIETASVTIYRAIGFGAIAVEIPEGFAHTLKKNGNEALFITGFFSTLIVTLLTRPVKITNAWLNFLYPHISNAEYLTASAEVKWSDFLYGRKSSPKNIMSLTVAAGLAGLIISSFKQPSIGLMIAAVITALPFVMITPLALRELEILKIAMAKVGPEELKARRKFPEPKDPEMGVYEKRYALCLKGFNALAALYADNKGIQNRANTGSFLGRVARGSSFLYFSTALTHVGMTLSKAQAIFMALVFAPHNLLNEFVAFHGGMVSYMTQKAAQATVRHHVGDYNASAEEPAEFHMWSMISSWQSFIAFWYGKADFTPNELLYTLEVERDKLHALIGGVDESAINRSSVIPKTEVLRHADQPKLYTFVESVQNFFAPCSASCFVDQNESAQSLLNN